VRSQITIDEMKTTVRSETEGMKTDGIEIEIKKNGSESKMEPQPTMRRSNDWVQQVQPQ